jgi:hypothetical protein
MDVIGQSTQVNPSLMPENGMYFGIPGLSSTSFLFSNSGFTWRDLHRIRLDDSVSLELDYAISKLADKNFISLSARENILEAGFKIKNNYFTLNVSEKANFNLTFPKELFELLYRGNGAFIGQEVDLKRMSFDITHYREYAVGWTRALNKKVTVGGRLKYLYGMENISSAKSSLSFYTAPDDYQIELTSDYVINTSLAGNSSGNSGSYIFGYKNTGFATDLSATYQYSERWKFNTSIIDLGYINWKSNVKNMVTASGSYVFGGIDINKFINDSTSSMSSVTDSLSDSFKPIENNDSYKTSLPTHVYFNAAYLLTSKMNATGLLHAEIFRETVQPTFTAALNRRWNDYLSTSISYSMINHHFDNLGFGFAFHDGAFQWYVLSDNIIGTINPLSNHTAHIQFGFNLIYGRQKNKKPVDYGVQNKIKSDTKSATEQEPQEDEDAEKDKEKDKDKK